MSKVMVSLPSDLLSAIDEEAARRSTSRSGFLAAAARHELARATSEEMEAAIARSVQRFNRSGAFEAADIVRRDRDSRR
jgi:metal-responsive CopG/Arc/MetJ family transcriptional regulator